MARRSQPSRFLAGPHAPRGNPVTRSPGKATSSTRDDLCRGSHAPRGARPSSRTRRRRVRTPSGIDRAAERDGAGGSSRGARYGFAAWHATFLRWPTVVGLLLSVILFVPVGRFSIATNLPFGLELYRLAVAVVLVAWAGSLLVDPRVQLRRSPFQISLLVILCATFGSIVVNASRVMPLGSAVLKAATFFLSFVLVHYFILSIVRERHAIENVTKLLVSGTATVAVVGVIEQRTQFNIFDHVDRVLPFLQFNGSFGR